MADLGQISTSACIDLHAPLLLFLCHIHLCIGSAVNHRIGPITLDKSEYCVSISQVKVPRAYTLMLHLVTLQNFAHIVPQLTGYACNKYFHITKQPIWATSHLYLRIIGYRAEDTVAQAGKAVGASEA